MSAKITQISQGAQGVFIKTSRFNTTLVSFNFYLPLSRENVAKYALVPFILTTCSEKYPDFSRLNLKLAKLYGAHLSASSEKVGDYQLLKISISVIDDRFTLDNESLCDQALELLMNLVFEPKVKDGMFYPEDVEREKRKAIEHIQGELSEKRIYAKTRLIEEMYKNSAYGAPKCGTVEDVEAIDGADLFEAWQRILSDAFIRINVISRNIPSSLFDGVAKKLSTINRNCDVDCTKNTATRKARTVKTVTEKMDIAQGKLCLGFSSKLHNDDKSAAALTVMCDIFGGGPYSKLFTNVREKLSLCYYCAASSSKPKGLLTVDSGVEAENADLAQQEILNQLNAIKNGEFTDFEFESSIKNITDSLNTYNDSQGMLDVWYSIKVTSENTLSPEEVGKYISAVTKEGVIRAAKGVHLHTVYRLLPKECDAL